MVVMASCARATIDGDDQLWQSWKAAHGKSYRSRSADDARRAVFFENVEEVVRLTREAGGQTSYVLNKYADLTTSEFARAMLRFNVSVGLQGLAPVVASARARVTIPDSVDYREQNATGPVADQGDCGSCWAFSIAGMCEAVHALRVRREGALLPPYVSPDALSAQQLVDCVTTNYGCGGGDTVAAVRYAIQRGLMINATYPYAGRAGRCVYRASAVRARFSGGVSLPAGDEASLARAVAERGPVSVAIDASSAAFRFYGSGVLRDRACGSVNLNHAVVLVGYTKSHWIAKNSWGSSWGANGYINIARDAGNLCGVATYAVAMDP